MFTLFEAEGDESGVNLLIPELATTLGAVEAFEETVDVLLAVHLLWLSLRWANVDLVLASTLEVGILHIEVSNLEIELGGERTKGSESLETTSGAIVLHGISSDEASFAHDCTVDSFPLVDPTRREDQLTLAWSEVVHETLLTESLHLQQRGELLFFCFLPESCVWPAHRFRMRSRFLHLGC
jgi:hypothetical protein